MTPEQAKDFYEEDEDPKRIFALLHAGPDGRTAPPSEPLRSIRFELERIREALASILRILAEVVEPDAPKTARAPSTVIKRHHRRYAPKRKTGPRQRIPR
jgi:rubrerythrin